MKRVIEAKDLGIIDFPERGDVAVWEDVTPDWMTVPLYRCSSCMTRTLTTAPSAYCPACGALIVNWRVIKADYDAKVAALGKEHHDDEQQAATETGVSE